MRRYASLTPCTRPLLRPEGGNRDSDTEEIELNDRQACPAWLFNEIDDVECESIPDRRTK